VNSIHEFDAVGKRLNAFAENLWNTCRFMTSRFVAVSQRRRAALPRGNRTEPCGSWVKACMKAGRKACSQMRGFSGSEARFCAVFVAALLRSSHLRRSVIDGPSWRPRNGSPVSKGEERAAGRCGLKRGETCALARTKARHGSFDASFRWPPIPADVIGLEHADRRAAGAAMTALMMGGAMEQLLEMSIAYAHDGPCSARQSGSCARCRAQAACFCMPSSPCRRCSKR
jgi:hypothetical protein